MLSAEELKALLETEGEDVCEIQFKECRVGDVFLARTESGDVYLFELTNLISRRANIYKIRRDNPSSGIIFYGNHHIIYPIFVPASTSFAEEYVERLAEIKKVRSG